MFNDAVYFIRRDLENLYKYAHELGDQQDLVSKQVEEMFPEDSNEHSTLSSMMEQTSLALFQLQFRIERLAESIQTALDRPVETERNEIFQEILDSCEQLEHITTDLVSE